MTTLIKRAIAEELGGNNQTANDEFNSDIPENEFPRTGMSARAAQAIVVSEASARDIARRKTFKNHVPTEPADKVSPIIA